MAPGQPAHRVRRLSNNSHSHCDSTRYTSAPRDSPLCRQPSVATEVSTSPAPPDLVYDLIAEVTRMGQWSPECYRCEWLDGATTANPGTRFRGYSRLGRYRWERTAIVNTADRGREFTFTTTDDRTGRLETQWQYTMQPTPSGTLLTESFEFLASKKHSPASSERLKHFRPVRWADAHRKSTPPSRGERGVVATQLASGCRRRLARCTSRPRSGPRCCRSVRNVPAAG